MDPSTAVVVVAYGDPGNLDRSLAPVTTRFPTVVVDNSSSAAVREVVRRRGGSYVDSRRNLGFAAGVNLGMRHVDRGAENVLLLNPDAVIGPAEIRRLSAILRAEPDIACVAPAQHHPDGGPPALVLWPVPSPSRAWLEAIGLGGARVGPSFLIGSVLMMSRAAITDVGPFDERFFLYAEETDWQIRALHRGWRIRYCPRVRATHIGAGTGGSPIRRHTYFYASQERLLRKHYGSAGWQVYRAGSIAGALIRMVVRRGGQRADALRRLILLAAGPVRAESRLDSPRS